MKKADVDVENLSMSSSMDNYFELLNLPQKFEIDKKQLFTNYIQLQQLFHPDKLVNKSSAEKILGAKSSANLNNAYQILGDDKKRAEHLLLLNNIIINNDDSNVKPDISMLAEIMELSEDPNKDKIAVLKHECIEIFKTNYPDNLQKAAQAIIKLQYLTKL
jgi:molecular chaperone HscB